MQVTANYPLKDIDENIQIMDDICAENGITDSCQLIHSAKTIKIMMLMKPDTIKEAFLITEEVYPQQLKKLKNCKTHPFLEQTMSQRAQLFKIQ
jgi:hypothetical protein